MLYLEKILFDREKVLNLSYMKYLKVLDVSIENQRLSEIAYFWRLFLNI